MENSYTSMERMMELGLGVGLAQQMMRTMSECMQQTTVPQVQMQAPQMPQPPAQQTQPAAPAPQTGYHVVIDENVAGPFDEQQLTMLAQKGKLQAETLVWTAGMANWLSAKQVPEINKILILTQL